MKRLLAAFILALVAACTTQPQTPAQAVYAVQASYQAALTVAVAYKQLPACGGAVAVCSNPAVVKQLQKADDGAYTALAAAQTIVTTPGAGMNAHTAIVAAEQAVGVLTALTSTLVTK